MRVARSLEIPQRDFSLIPRGQVGSLVRERMEATIAGQFKLPVRSKALEWQRVTVQLEEDLVSRIRMLADCQGLDSLSDSELMARAFIAGDASTPEESPPQNGNADSADNPISTLVRGMFPNSARNEQLVAAGFAYSATSQGLIGLVEAATGVGKSAVAAATAVHWSTHGAVCVIACPTHAVIAQQYQALKRAMIGRRKRPIAVLRGRGEFVSENRLLKMCGWLCEEAGETDLSDQLQQWASGQDPKRADAWTVDSLAEQVPTAPVSDVRLLGGGEDSDAGERMYQAQRAAANGAKIVICTHAMLGYDISMRAAQTREAVPRRGPDESAGRYSDRANAARVAADAGRAALLPAYGCLIVDEAHSLERAIAEVRSSDVSFMTALRCAKSVGGSAMAIERIEHLVGELRQVGQQSDAIGIVSGRHPLMHTVNSILLELERCLKSAKRKRHRASDFEELKTVVAGLSRAMKVGAGSRVEIRFSPVRRFPSIHVGPTSVRAAMRFLWARVIEAGYGGVCMSATLFTPTSTGAAGARHIQEVLGLRESDCVVFKPLVPDWLIEPVTVVRPPADCAKLTPPKSDKGLKQSELDEWYVNLGRWLNTMLEDARGGVLVLCSSYALADGLAGAIRAILYEPGRVVLSTRDTPFSALLDIYKRMATTGQRPVWMAVGIAWTGIDLIDSSQTDASQDRMVDRLVIPKLPFGLDSSAVHQHRVKASQSAGFTHERDRMLFTLRQGMGRLVRRPGLVNKEIWIGDARGFCAQTGYSGAVRQLVQQYKQRLVDVPCDE